MTARIPIVDVAYNKHVDVPTKATLSDVANTKLTVTGGMLLRIAGNEANTKSVWVCKIAKGDPFTWDNDKVMDMIEPKETKEFFCDVAAFDWYVRSQVLNEKIAYETLTEG